jgi:hypothetical protein
LLFAIGAHFFKRSHVKPETQALITLAQGGRAEGHGREFAAATRTLAIFRLADFRYCRRGAAVLAMFAAQKHQRET